MLCDGGFSFFCTSEICLDRIHEFSASVGLKVCRVTEFGLMLPDILHDLGTVK